MGGLFAGDKLPISLVKSETSTVIINPFTCDKQLFASEKQLFASKSPEFASDIMLIASKIFLPASDIVLLSDIVLIACDNYAFYWQVKIFH